MSAIYLSGIGGSGKARYLFRRISETLSSGGKNSDLRVFAFVKDEELILFYDDLRAFLNASSLNSSGIAPDVALLPCDDPQQAAYAVDKIKNSKRFIICASDISINSPLPAGGSCTAISVNKNGSFKIEDLVKNLVCAGYGRVNFVEDRLQFAVRGDIIDVWPAANDMPVRILFEYETVEALRIFDPGTQLSNSFIDEIKILPVKIPKDGLTVKDFFFPHAEKTSPTLLFFDYPLGKDEELRYESGELIINDPLNAQALYQEYKSFAGFQGDVKFFLNSLEEFARGGVNMQIYCANSGEKERISDMFADSGWKYAPPEFFYGNLSRGFYAQNENLACISSREMLYKKAPVSFPKIKGGRRLEGIWEISAGDYVVHEKYGIGRYAGLKTISRHDKTSEYMCIEYAKGDRLYVPPESIKTVKKYIGVEGVKPKLYSMDGAAWERVKSRAREAAAAFAKELLNLYAQRSMTKRSPYSRETAWERELADAFPYKETPDQLKAIEDVKSDFLKPYPMERLICGDVGYGKTEVAIRAAFKAVQEGMQAAVLVPTTVLAQQHFNTFCNRLSPFPTKVEVLSRFQSKNRQKEILKAIEEGRIDIIVGTHRLLQKDVSFKNLGMLIIDEEHRFGVKQKEKIKTIKKNIDVLMLSATPIPRTLSSALSGFRDLSVIETPPFGRLPIETYLSLYDENLVKKIIEAELSRGGQVFYVYNKVETILTKAAEIKKLAADIKLGVIHGQMKAKEIENIMWKFTNAELDVLLATTIIESGLDIPSVNTMIVEEAENFGLSQLYQLRGRIGRERKKAYCYLFYKDKTLSDEAVKRLEAMKDFSELGSGFRLALKDLEIRGAGGILSANQHGFVRDIGYDMFAKLLEEEGKKAKGETFAPEKKSNDGEIDLQTSALIPNSYIEDDEIRILFYRKLSDAKDYESLRRTEAELADRFGKLPPETQKLFEIMALRIKAAALNVERIFEDDRHLYFYFSAQADFSKADIARLIKDYGDIIEFMSPKTHAFKLKKSGIGMESVSFLEDFLEKASFYFKMQP